MSAIDFDRWLSVAATGNLDGPYAHLWLIQPNPAGWHTVRTQLLSYLERAHRDAYEYFKNDLGLDPFNSTPAGIAYPSSLPPETLRGYFGEAFCGMIAEGLELVGRRKWTVPAFLFRFHNQAGEHLTRLVYGESVPIKIAGRTGSDFIGLALDSERKIEAFLVGEAKCHEKLNVTKAHEALEDLGAQAALPVSLGQLKRILREVDDGVWLDTIKSIDEIQFSRTTIPRTDLFVYVHENPMLKDHSACRLTESAATESHKLARPLQIVEVRVQDMRQMVTELYQELLFISSEETAVDEKP